MTSVQHRPRITTITINKTIVTLRKQQTVRTDQEGGRGQQHGGGVEGEEYDVTCRVERDE